MSMRRFDDALAVYAEYRESGEETEPVSNTLAMAQCFKQKGVIDSTRQLLEELVQTSTGADLPYILRDLSLLETIGARDLTTALELAERASAEQIGSWFDYVIEPLLRLRYTSGQTDDVAKSLEQIQSYWVRPSFFYRKAQIAAATGSGSADMYLEHAISHLTRMTRGEYSASYLCDASAFLALALARAGKPDEARHEIKHDDNTRTHIVLAKGTMVSHYRIVEKIGAGGMGEVYLAEDTSLKRQVALKFLPLQLVADPDAKTRFTREAQAAASLSHPNIAHVYEVSQFHGRPFFAMELVEGQSLRDIVKRGDIPLDKIIDYATQICEGLQEAHAVGIVHRDVKPANIILSKRGRPKIVDFGLAAIRGTEKLTQTGSTLGTIGYMSPEQVQGREVDHRSDLFAFGVVLYELIAGKRPFEGENDAATMNAINTQSPQPLARYRADVPDDLQRIVTKLLEKDPQLRYQRAEGVIPDLKRLIVASTSYIAPAAPKPRANKVLVGAAIVLLAVVAAGVVYKLLAPGQREMSEGKKMLAVLPFENLGSSEDEYFADGITEEILTNLARLSGLGVISRTSAMQYKNTDKGLREIGKELGVDYVLEGTIRRDKTGEISRVRIHPQLIRVSDDVHVWADRYDAVLSDVFEVQSSIAEKVAQALNVTLLETEREALAEQPTENTEAYDYYLRGKQYYSIGAGRDDHRSAEAMHLKAIELEPEFALAYAELGIVYTDMYWDFYDRTEQRLATAKEAIDRALELAPDDPVTHLALGWYHYHGHLDYERALNEFAVVLEKEPSNSLAIASIAWVKRRQGQWDEAIEGLRKATKLNPREPHLQYELGLTLAVCRRYEEAEHHYDRTIDLAPDYLWAYLMKSWLHGFGLGDTKQARRVLEEALERNGRWPQLTFFEWLYDFMDGDFDQALQHITKPGDIYLSEGSDSSDYYLCKGEVYRHLDQTDLMIPLYDSARLILEACGRTHAGIEGCYHRRHVCQMAR
jgi:TolB-like protein/Tfp pilus assembly protein PilF/predicted Ser/Thr protein kinase